MKEIKFADWVVTKIFVLRDRGTDKISFTCHGAPTPFPELDVLEKEEKYPPHFGIETRRGYAEEWLGTMFGIQMDDERIEFLDTNKKKNFK